MLDRQASDPLIAEPNPDHPTRLIPPRSPIPTPLTPLTPLTPPSPDFPTIDPAPSLSPQSIPDLHAALLNTKLPLFERYRAMFALRDFGAGSRDAVLALAEGFGDESALFR